MVAYLVGKKMFIIKKPKLNQPHLYKTSHNPKVSFYGLPKKIIYCKTCTYTNQKPNSEKEYKHNLSTKQCTI